MPEQTPRSRSATGSNETGQPAPSGTPTAPDTTYLTLARRIIVFIAGMGALAVVIALIWSSQRPGEPLLAFRVEEVFWMGVVYLIAGGALLVFTRPQARKRQLRRPAATMPTVPPEALTPVVSIPRPTVMVAAPVSTRAPAAPLLTDPPAPQPVPEPQPQPLPEPLPIPTPQPAPDPVPEPSPGPVPMPELPPIPPTPAPSPPAIPPAPAGKAPDDLLQILGLLPEVAATLNAAGLTTFDQLAAMSPRTVYQLCRVHPAVQQSDAQTWVRQAQHYVTGDAAAVQAYQDRLRQQHEIIEETD